MTDNNGIEYPYVIFKLKGNCYAISSKNVYSISEMPEYEEVPDTSDNIMGIFTFRGRVSYLLDMRGLFGLSALNEEYRDFSGLLEQRKQDHIQWVDELNRSIAEGKKFHLTTDPHKCAFGRWYDTYSSDNQNVNFILKKIDEPHQKLHQAAIEVERFSQNHEGSEKEENVKRVMEQVEGEYMPKILQYLDDLKEQFQHLYKEMVIVLDNGRAPVGLVSDEVISVEQLEDISEGEKTEDFQGSQYISDIKKNEKIPGVILLLDDELLMEAVRTKERAGA